MTGRSEFVDLVRPLHERLDLYDRTRRPTDQPSNDAADPVRACPQAFIDAMIVREEVYVKEQNVALENEVDDDDPRSYHWVAYASIPAPSHSNNNSDNNNDNDGTARPRSQSTSTKIPIGTIRLVPHPTPTPTTPSPSGDGGSSSSSSGTDTPETYCKLGRLAVIPEFRKAGISKLLVETALAYARHHPQEMDGPQPDPTSIEAAQRGRTARATFRGCVLVHSQVGVQKVWARYGFERDENLGEWDEEGIAHCGMWKRMDVAAGRKEEGRRKVLVPPGA